MDAQNQFPELTMGQMQAVRHLLRGDNLVTVACFCGVSERTVRAWKQQPAFRAALAAGRAQLLDHAQTQLSLAAATAVETLVEICSDREQNGTTRVAAAGKLLTFIFRHVPGAPSTLAGALNAVEAAAASAASDAPSSGADVSTPQDGDTPSAPAAPDPSAGSFPQQTSEDFPGSLPASLPRWLQKPAFSRPAPVDACSPSDVSRADRFGAAGGVATLARPTVQNRQKAAKTGRDRSR